MADDHGRIATIAQRRNLSLDAVEALAAALRRGHGAAQWNHPDLGGMGQWAGGGMLQIGDMFNHDLKGRIAAALDDLRADQPAAAAGSDQTLSAQETWWPADWEEPSATGAQHGMRYACFPDRRRLVEDQGGAITVYDTGRFRLTGFSQAQGNTSSLSFSGPDGPVSLRDLTPLR